MNNSFEVDILVNNKPVRKYSHQGRTFIEAKEGTEYSIKIRNHSNLRKLVVCAIDGLNVLDGKAGGKSNNGYIINGFDSYEIKGFRTSNDSVNVFKFAKKSKSYAAKSDETNGDTSNCGVIGVEVYDELVKPYIIKHVMFPFHHEDNIDIWPIQPYRPTWTCDSSSGGGLKRSFTSNSPQLNCNLNNNLVSNSLNSYAQGARGVAGTPETPAFDMGTQFSDKEVTDRVREVEFEIGTLSYRYEFFYASKDSLLDIGVPIVREGKVSFPQAFPTKFCKPPKD
jgi:hypothetical protein